MDKFIRDLAQLPQDRQKAIREGLQKQIIAQAEFVRDEQPTKFLTYIDGEIQKADASMFEMVQESSREGAELYNISEIYIWNKQRKQALVKLRDEYLQQIHQNKAPEQKPEPEQAAQEPQQTMPNELNNDEAKRYFKKAIDIGLMDANYKWLKGLQLLACFARDMSINLHLGKGVNSHDSPRISWKPFETLFKLPVGKLRLNYNDIQKTGQPPRDIWMVDKVFE